MSLTSQASVPSHQTPPNPPFSIFYRTMTATTTTTLTAAACARLNDANDYRVLVESPVVQITKLETRTAFEVCDFAVDQVATVSDGKADAQVLLPLGLRIFGCGADLPRGLRVDDVIKVERMLRLPQGAAQRCASRSQCLSDLGE